MIEIIGYLSFFDLFHLVVYPLDLSMLLQMLRFHSFLWPSTSLLDISIYLYIHHVIFIHSSVDGLFHILPTVNSAAI